MFLQRPMKKLTKEEIEEFGFTFLPKRSIKGLCHRYSWEGYNERIEEEEPERYWNLSLKHYPGRGRVFITADCSSGTEDKFFDGIVKNKYELMLVFKFLNIKYREPHIRLFSLDTFHIRGRGQCFTGNLPDKVTQEDLFNARKNREKVYIDNKPYYITGIELPAINHEQAMELRIFSVLTSPYIEQKEKEERD